MPLTLGRGITLYPSLGPSIDAFHSSIAYNSRHDEYLVVYDEKWSDDPNDGMSYQVLDNQSVKLCRAADELGFDHVRKRIWVYKKSNIEMG